MPVSAPDLWFGERGIGLLGQLICNECGKLGFCDLEVDDACFCAVGHGLLNDVFQRLGICC